MRMWIACSFTVTAGLIVAGQLSAGDKKGTVVNLEGLKSETPADWKMEKPINKLRLYQFSLPGKEKDADLAVFYFPGGGSVDANVKRWKDRFIAPKGKSIEDISKIEKFKVGDAEVTFLDISGTYIEQSPTKPNAEKVRREGYRFFGIYVDHKNGPHFITVTGPAETLESHKAAFDRWLKNFK